MTMRAMLAVLLAVTAMVLAGSGLPALAHEGHDHDKPPPLNLPVAPRVVAVTPELELVGVLSGSDRLTVFLHHFESNAPVAGARMTVSADQDSVEAKAEGDGVFTVEAPWIAKGESVDLVFALKLADGGEDLLTGRLEVPQSLETAMAPDAHATEGWWGVLYDRDSLIGYGVAFSGGVLLTLLLVGRRRRSPSVEPPAAQRDEGEAGAVADAKADDSSEAVTPLRRTAVMLGFVLLASATPFASARAEPAKARAAMPSIPSTMATDLPQRMPDGTLFVPKATQHLLSIRTRAVSNTKAAKTVTLSGRVAVGPQNLGRVQPNRPGRFVAAGERVGYVGMKVEAGQILGHVETYIEAADRANITSQIAETEARIAKNRTILSRYEKSPGAVPQVRVDEVRGELQALIKRRDELLPSTSAREPLVAPIAGVISAARVVVGQVVDTRDVLFEIIDPSEFWVEAITPNPEVVDNLSQAVATVHDHHVLDLEYLGRGLALRNHATVLNFKVLNSGENIAVGMTARVILKLKDEQEGIVLPTSAVVRGATGLPIVWVKTAPERFEPHTVSSEAFDGDQVVITAGLKVDQRVVTEGVTLLNQVR